MEQSEGSGDTSFMISEVDSANLDAANMTTDTQRCEFCNCSRTPLWRRGPQGARTLCNACGIRWSNNKAKETGGKPEYYTEDAINDPQQGEEMYQLDCRTGEAVAVVSSTHGSLEPAWCNVDASTSLIQGRDLEPEKSAVILASKGFHANEEEEHETHDSANEAWEEESGISAMEDSPRLSAEEGEDEDLHGSIKIEAGKENYYCKYCDTSWPFNHFRNAQQFGAHCSNCSRKRKVKDPQELTIRERNKRMRKVKKPSHSEKRRQHTRASMERDDARHLSTGCSDEGDGGDSLSSNNGSSEEDFEASGISFLHQAAVASAERERPTSSSSRSHRSRRSRKGKRKLDELASQVQDDAGSSDPFAIPFVRSSSRVSRSLASQGATKKPKREVTSKKKHSSSKSKMVLVTPEEELEHAAVVSDPNSLGGLLAAIERKLTSEKKKKDAAALKQRVWGMRKEVGEQFNSSVEDLRFRSVALVQDLRLDMVAKLEGLKLDLASELSFRETRRKKRLNEMRIQMNALNRILENGKKERENGLLVSTFGGKFDVALKQLEELKANLQKEFSSREQAMQQQFTEMRATCSLHLANIKQQMHEELNVRENRMQKELEEMKHKLHSVCSQIGAENYDADTPIPLSATSSVLASLPGPEKYTTTTTTTTTTTITTNINAPALLPASLGLGVSLPSLVELTTSMAVGAGVPPLSKGVASSTNPLTLNGPAPTKQPPLLPSSPNGAGALAFGCLAEIKSATS